MDVRSDVVFKKIFADHPELIKSFLNAILPLSEDRLIKTISYITPEQAPRIPSMKNTIVDVKCTDQKGRIFIVEMQLAWRSSFMKRFVFGASKAFVQQMKKGSSYGSLCPVYGLAILNEAFEKTTEEWYHHYRLTNTKDLDKSLEGLELIFVELQKFKPQTFKERKMGVLWLRFLREVNEGLVEIPQEFQDNHDIAMAVELAQESSYTPEELALYDLYLDAIRVEQTVREDSLEEGEQIGLKKGKQIGEQIGLEKGKEKEQANLRLLAKKLRGKGLSPQEVLELTGLNELEP